MDTKNKIISLLKDTYNMAFDVDDIENLNLIEYLNLDSLSYVGLIVEIENAFSITISEDHLIMNSVLTVKYLSQIVDIQI